MVRYVLRAQHAKTFPVHIVPADGAVQRARPRAANLLHHRKLPAFKIACLSSLVSCPVTYGLPSVSYRILYLGLFYQLAETKPCLLVLQVTCKAAASLLNKDGMAHFIAAVKTIAEPYEVSEGDPPQKAPFTVFNGTVQAVSNDEALTMLKSRVQVCMHQDDV